MSKILVFLFLALAVYLAIKAVTCGKRGRKKTETRAENMVACAHCGVNLPRSEALEADANWFCGEEHRRLHAG